MISRPRSLEVDCFLIVSRVYWPEPKAAAFRLEALTRELSKQASVAVLTGSPQLSMRRYHYSGPAGEDVEGLYLSPAHGEGLQRILSVLAFDLLLILRLPIKILATKPRVIIAEPPPSSGLVTALVARVFRTPVVYYAADLWAEMVTTSSWLRRGIKRLGRYVEGAAMRRSSRVVTVNTDLRGMIERLHGVTAVVVGNGVETSLYTPPPPYAVRTEVVYAGTLGVAQGAGVLADLASIADNENLPLSFSVYGDGVDRVGLASAVKNRKLTNLTLNGSVTPNEVARHLRFARAAIVTLKEETVYSAARPTKVFAALACGTPVLFIGPEGPLAREINSHGLGLAIRRRDLRVGLDWLTSLAVDETDRARMRQWALANGSLEAVAKTVARLVSDTASGKEQR